jgi:GTP cyclohydrolase II
MNTVRMNHKQRELIEELFQTVHTKYPQTRITGYELNPDDKEHIWVIVEAVMDEDTEIELRTFAAALSADVQMDYGYSISLMTENPTLGVA